MHSNHAILVNIPDAAESVNMNLAEMTKEEIKEMVINYATEETERFADRAFDYRVLLDDEEHEEGEIEFGHPVVFANEDWEIFEEILIEKDRGQKAEAKFTLEYLKETAGSTDVSEILSNLLLANDRTANREDVDSNTWRFDFLNQGTWALRHLANLIHGDYIFDSAFYDTSRGTALVPFIAKLKENPSEWALVQFDYHN